MERFDAWRQEVTRRGLHEQVAVLAGIQPLCDGTLADVKAGRRPAPRVPQATLDRIASKGAAAEQRAAAIEVAVETIRRLSGVKGLRGFSISADGDHDAALEVISRSGLGSN